MYTLLREVDPLLCETGCEHVIESLVAVSFYHRDRVVVQFLYYLEVLPDSTVGRGSRHMGSFS
jgi:hypothetical protein